MAEKRVCISGKGSAKVVRERQEEKTSNVSLLKQTSNLEYKDSIII